MQVAEIKLRCVLDGTDVGSLHAVDANELMADKETLTKRYGNDFLLLQQLMKKAEQEIENHNFME
jgi:hypothetical protein